MKKYSTILASIMCLGLSLQGYANATSTQELQESIALIYNIGITKYSTIETYMTNSDLRRDEAAAMYVRLGRSTGLIQKHPPV